MLYKDIEKLHSVNRENVIRGMEKSALKKHVSTKVHRKNPGGGQLPLFVKQH